MSSLTYLTAVGYSSTVAAFTTLPPMPAHMSAINAYTCISGLSVSMQIIPPKPLPTKTTTVAWKYRQNILYQIHKNIFLTYELT